MGTYLGGDGHPPTYLGADDHPYLLTMRVKEGSLPFRHEADGKYIPILMGGARPPF